VPVDEIEPPILDIRNDTLLYLVAFLVFALPLHLDRPQTRPPHTAVEISR
jgi:hypothetical protein